MRSTEQVSSTHGVSTAVTDMIRICLELKQNTCEYLQIIMSRNLHTVVERLVFTVQGGPNNLAHFWYAVTLSVPFSVSLLVLIILLN